MAIPTQAEIAARLSGENLDEWLKLWWTEQGPAKPGALELMAAVIPFSPDAELQVLDMCCGPGDVGRFIRARFRNARIDCVDRDPFLACLCAALNRREGVPGRTLVRDLNHANWCGGLARNYDVVATANALHWFNLRRAAELLEEVFALLRSGGAFILMEPAGPEAAFAASFSAWKLARPSQHKREDWLRFWSRINTLLGYDHIKQLANQSVPGRIDDRLSVLGWIGLLKGAGFESIDVLLRDCEKVVLSAVKP